MTGRRSSVMVYRTGQLGDTLVTIPAMRALRKAYPDDDFVLVTDRFEGKGFVSSWDILETTGIFTGVLFYAPPQAAGGWRSLWRLASEIRSIRPAAFFYMRDPHWQSRDRDHFFFKILCGVRHSYGFDDAQPDFGVRDSSGNLVRYPNEVEYWLNVVRRWGIPIPDSAHGAIALDIRSEDRDRVNEFWTQNDIPDRTFVVGIGPGSKMPAKRWPLGRFIEVGRLISAVRPEARFVVFGGPEDRSHGEEIRHALGNKVANAAGSLTLLQGAEALRRCQAYVGNDSGTMHLAAAVGTPCIAIFSARDHPGRWDPYGPQHFVLRHNPACSGCLLNVCIDEDMKCLRDVYVHEVMDRFHALLARHNGHIN